MSDIENRKIQDVLREVADNAESQNAYALVQRLCREVGVIEDDESSYCEDLRDCLREIADRVDRQGVVEVRVPGNPSAWPVLTADDPRGIPWPLDADGRPLHFGDAVEAEVKSGEFERGTIEGVGRDGDVLVAMRERGSYWLTPDRVRHHRPRTLEDVLADMAGLTECEDWGERAEGLVREAYEMGRACDE